MEKDVIIIFLSRAKLYSIIKQRMNEINLHRQYKNAQATCADDIIHSLLSLYSLAGLAGQV